MGGVRTRRTPPLCTPLHWSIALQVPDVIHQFTQGTPNYNTKPKSTIFGILTEPELESCRSNHQLIDRGAGLLQSPVYGEVWAKGHVTGTPDSTFPRYGSPPTENMRVRLKNQSRHKQNQT
ncbi:hypothetical protein TNCV_1826601 [Trichonephila clavipes]|nr:hypothetical protein TNCV_1826601 [Trichonephila clavipes]